MLLLTLAGASCLFLWTLHDRCWYRAGDIDLVVNKRKARTLPTYIGKGGKILIMTQGETLLMDSSGLLGFPQGGNWLTTPWLALGVSHQAMLVPIGKSGPPFVDVELRGPQFKNGRITGSLPLALVGGIN